MADQEQQEQEQEREWEQGEVEVEAEVDEEDREQLPESDDTTPHLTTEKSFDEIMEMTNEERSWAMTVKAAVESSEDICPLPDLEYVQFALISRGNLEEAMERIRGLQEFRQEYNINDNLEEGNEILHKFVKHYHPGCILTVAYNDVDDNFVFIYDRSQLRYDSLRLPEEWRIAFGAIFYINHMMSQDVKAMREGSIFIAECEGVTRHRLSFNAISTFWHHFLHHYPMKYKEIKFFHTNVITNLSFSMMKPLMRPEIRECFHIGCQFGANIGSLYRLPTPEIAKERTLRRLEFFLKRRYANQARFKL
jgi:hypothetical protein